MESNEICHNFVLLQFSWTVTNSNLDMKGLDLNKCINTKYMKYLPITIEIFIDNHPLASLIAEAECSRTLSTNVRITIFSSSTDLLNKTHQNHLQVVTHNAKDTAPQ